ncbi:hypothetical protein CLV91_1518 [Maribacter vaceletii]|uniref:Uncharacterized protein n=1 Tax=Maribacter vaceletii TaxID=1206816 RepID=A0A495E833_9FLAO|nr:hypothetical protein [Maribacter vaceletii]RKR12811.1 hypothetical protein CLV91_1518 [Maribacter vaceletii]
MRNLVIVLLFISMSPRITANTSSKSNDIKIGTKLEIGHPSTSNYKYLILPRKNFIIKKGGLANYKSLYNLNVVVTAIEKSNGNTIIVTLKHVDNKKFFNRYATIKANYKEAINAKELIFIE